MAPIVIVGPPGAGKSTTAQLVADRMGLAVRDTDADVEAEQGVSVQDIFIESGEARFRELEHEAVVRALAEHDGIVSLGGGAPVHEGTRELLREHRVVFLDVGLAQAAARVGMNSGRPLLLGNVRGQLKRLMDDRRPIYLEVATTVIDTDALSPDEVADAVIAFVEEDAR
ncbi:shikimate kinase [Aeromicrobium sp. PE09-221]|uniref:shikimate kinase n=1 Tax=Aeromicrobium sp. PE09-221 TaxID=1898043 RepID=UPI000B3E5EAF|nr:shikimate kinase [Aeromicrobium sp. PE09-221]OUZ09738.1 shikimate kinase [Aeromicrobium sp. PE09-221]